MMMLQKEQLQASIKMLKQAEHILLGIHKFQAKIGGTLSNEKRVYSLTLNNFGCYYKK